MAYDRVVLVHGGMLGSWCWEKVLPLLGCDVVAVDLPGRSGAAPIPATFDNWVDTVIQATAGKSLIVAHSLGGLVAVAAASRASDRVAGILFVSALVPPQGYCCWDLLPKPLYLVRRPLRIGEPRVVMPKMVARFLLCNGLSSADRDTILSRLVGEPGAVLGTPVEYRLDDGIDLTYVHTTHDRAVTPAQQRRYVALLPDRTRRLRLDCGHSAMYAKPAELAEIICQRL